MEYTRRATCGVTPFRMSPSFGPRRTPIINRRYTSHRYCTVNRGPIWVLVSDCHVRASRSSGTTGNVATNFPALAFLLVLALIAATDDPAFKPKWNELDGKVNRVSFIGGKYEIRDDCPVNPFGRTGIRGRGILGRWGPNHAADPVVTRWKRDESGEVILHPDSGKRILQMCAIERQDCGEWAIPGGMVDPGEKVSATLRREFLEETMDNDAGDEAGAVEQFFAEGTEIYKGYVDDPRNTDCAWMETVAVNFHDETGAVVGRFPLHAGDDAAKVRWMDVGEEVKLYASHSNIVKRVVDMLEAHW